MVIKDFISKNTNKQKVILTSKVSRVNALLKKLEKENGLMATNVKSVSFDSLIKEFFFQIQAKKGIDNTNEIIDDKTGNILLRDLLLEHVDELEYFNEPDMMSLRTTQEIYDKVNLVRSNGLKVIDDENKRIKDLIYIINQYEEELIQKNYYDSVSLLRYVLEHFDEIEDSRIFAYLKEEKNQLSGLELELLNKIKDITEISVFEKEGITINDLEHLKDKVSFFRGNGSFNEVMYIAYDIAKKSIPLGNVHILYSKATQIPVIQSVLKANNMPVRFISSIPMYDNPYISFIRRIFQWAKSDYSEKELENVLASPILMIKDNEVLDTDRYYSHVLNASNRYGESMILGWDYKRNKEFIKKQIEYINNKGKDKELLPLYHLHDDLLNVFTEDETGKPITIYENVLSFIDKYTKKKTKEYETAIKELINLESQIKMEDRVLPQEESMDFIESLLQDITTSESESGSQIVAEKINDWTVINRSNVYMIGLSLKELLVNTTESPVLTDEEMEMYLVKGYMPTVHNKTENQERNLFQTLKLLNNSSLTLGYSSFDALAFFRSNPSSFFKKMLDKFSTLGIEEIPEFIVGNPKEDMVLNYEQNEIDKKKSTDNFKIKLPTSSTGVENLVFCPKKYAYNRIYNLPTEDYRTVDSASWLKANERGTYFHKLMEEYANEKLIKPGKEEYAETADEDLLKELSASIKGQFLETIPVAFEELANDEVDTLLDYAKEYFNKLHEILNNEEKGWRILSCEQDFLNAKYEVKTFNNKKHTLTIRGQIDRVDYKLDHENEKVLLRVVDYKSGKKGNKEKELKKGALLQYELYKNAVIENGQTMSEDGEEISLLNYLKRRIIKLEENESLNNWEYVFESFIYEFPADVDAKGPLVIEFDESEPLNLLRLRYVLTMIDQLKTYPDIMELEEGVLDNAKEYSPRLEGIFLDEKASECKYCPFVDVCVNKKGGMF